MNAKDFGISADGSDETDRLQDAIMASRPLVRLI